MSDTTILKQNDWEDIKSLSYQLKEIIFSSVEPVLDGNVLHIDDIHLEHPSNALFGDYSTNLAMVLAKKVKMSPRDLAQKIVLALNEYINSTKNISIDRVEIAGGAFINLWVKKNYLLDLVERFLNTSQKSISSILEGKKIAVEYTDPNPFKEFHLGHLYSNMIGESISRLFEACGAIVWRGDFYGDVGMHVSKSVWGMVQLMKGEETTLSDLEKLTISQRQKFLGRGYALGVREYEGNEVTAEEIKNINYLIYVAGQDVLKKAKGWEPIADYKQYIKGKEDKLKEIAPVYEAGLRWSLDYFETIYKKLGTKFDGYYPESWVGEYGMQLVEKGLEMGILEKDDGAVVYKGEQDGFHTRVFVNKLGLPTYEAKDLGLALAKYKDFQYDASLNVFGKEIDEYYKVVRSAMRRIDPELGSKAYYIAHGMVKLPEGKMSSRSGNVITGEGLLEEAKKRVLTIMDSVSADLSKTVIPKEEKVEIAQKVGLAAIRYALLKNSAEKDVVFDFDKSLSFEGDSGPYVQYTYTRCQSVLRKSKIQNPKFKINPKSKIPASSAGGQKDQLNEEEELLLRTLYLFPEVVVDAARNLSANLICTYLFNLAQQYNLFYNKHSILGGSQNEIPNSKLQIPNQSIIEFRLFLTEATATILQKGLYLLGIATVERM